jgi:hypothetical protein
MNDETLPKSGQSLSANDRSGSGGTRGTPPYDPRRNSDSERVAPCHSGVAASASVCAGSEMRVAANAERLSLNDESVSPHVPTCAARSLVCSLWNSRVKVNASSVAPHLRTGANRNSRSSADDSRGPRSDSSGSARSPRPEVVLQSVAPRSSGASLAGSSRAQTARSVPRVATSCAARASVCAEAHPRRRPSPSRPGRSPAPGQGGRTASGSMVAAPITRP